MNQILIRTWNLKENPPQLRQYADLLTPMRYKQLEQYPPKRQQESLAGDLLALSALKRIDPEVCFPVERITTDRGKPFFPAYPAFYYSISHSGDWVICASANVPIGIDIQKKRPVNPATIRFLSSKEQHFLNTLPGEAREDTFFDIWCLKEAYVKATGLGLQQSFRSFDVQLLPESISDPSYQIAILSPLTPQYHIGIAVQCEMIPEMIIC